MKRVLLLGWMLGALAMAAPGSAAAIGDLSDVRGFNYTPASVDDEQIYLQYDDAEVNRDFGYARSLNLNHARIFLRYSEWAKDTPKFRDSFQRLLAAVKRHGLKVMFVLAPPRDMIAPPAEQAAESEAHLRAWLGDVPRMSRGHAEIFAWDVANEPDWPGFAEKPIAPDVRERRFALGRRIADIVHAADRRNLTTVGCWDIACVEQTVGYSDILSYHDYGATRELIAANAQRAKAIAARTGKPIVQTEVGCTGRGSPYDMALREYKRAGMGTYIWELMITKFWGGVHGVFYPDGSVRDPAIAAAVMGFFRQDAGEARLETPDRESWITIPLQRSAKWLAADRPDWKEGLEIAEIEANMLEANQLVAMRTPPSREVARLRAGPPDIPALRATMQSYAAMLTPYAGLGRLHGN